MYLGSFFLNWSEDQRMKELLQQTEQREKQRQDRLQQVLVQSMNNAVASNMERLVRQEMASTILPSTYSPALVISCLFFCTLNTL